MVEKQDLPVHRARAFLEPGPILLVTSCHDGERNVMTMGWHMVLEFTPSLVGCMISVGNHSFELIRQSAECVLNLPTLDMLDAVVAIGNCSGRDKDKFAGFNLDVQAADHIRAPLLTACHANFERRLPDDRMVKDYNLFIFEIVKAHVAPQPKHPRTLHYTGDGVFVVAGKTVSRRSDFRLGLLGNGR
ncbi:flavin reductase [Novosphingobium guangzhouense]|uniref:Flavin reductase n=2 Tax=Novosphingobium guangzhouense TaxID=1850347 RepID=A0A2K2FYH2_9SPHN|nr:flavin reductase [Novosphingobium guangzhouense]